MTKTTDSLNNKPIREGGRGGERDIDAGRYLEVDLAVANVVGACATGHTVYEDVKPNSQRPASVQMPRGSLGLAA